MTQSEGLGHRGTKCAKMADFKGYLISSAYMRGISRLTVNYDTPRQYLNFNWTDF